MINYGFSDICLGTLVGFYSSFWLKNHSYWSKGRVPPAQKLLVYASN